MKPERLVLVACILFLISLGGGIQTFAKSAPKGKAAYNAAKVMIREGRPRAAIHELQSALKGGGPRDGTTFSLRLLLAETDAYIGENKAAVEILKALAAERPNSAEVRFNLALTYARLGSLQTAVQQFREELRLKPGDYAGLMGLAKALLNLKKSSDAVP